MGLQIHIDDIPGRETDPDTSENVVGGWKKGKMVYGKTLNLAYFERGDYHSSPHRHTAEQLNYIMEGEIWWFVEDQGYLLTPGDFHRVPANAVHWAKTEEAPIKMMEAHAPPLIGEGAKRKQRSGLFTDDETEEPDDYSVNVAVEVEDWREIEQEAMERYYAEH